MELFEDPDFTQKSILFRKTEVALLSQFLQRKYFQYRSLFVYGHRTTGKTFIVSKLLKEFSVPHVWVNCYEYYNSQLIFTTVVNQLSQTDDHKKISNICDFINFLKSFLIKSCETTYLVFDNAEVLRKEGPLLIPVLLRLQNLSNANVCPIFISELAWDGFQSQNDTIKPVILHFPNYSKTEICDILCSNCPSGITQNFYHSYVNVILRTFFTVTKNLSELRYLTEINFDTYCEPLKKNPEEELSSMRLWKHIEPTLKEAMRFVYLREISGSKWKTYCKSEVRKDTSDLSSASSCITRELPFYSKFLLLAAYFASYNSPKNDFKHFVKNQGKQGKKRITKKIEKNRHLLGPKSFSLDRLLSIFFSIVGERVLPSALIFSQISSLVHMRLMSRVSVDEQLDCPKYKCLAELDIICKIGKTVSIDVMGYLDDFL